MTRMTKIVAALGVGVAALAAGAAWAQNDDSASLRSSGSVGEQADGYLGIVGQASPSVRDQVSSINIRRRAFYTDVAAKRGVTVSEMAAATACGLFKNKVQHGQFYRLPDGVWRKREGAVELPAYCS